MNINKSARVEVAQFGVKVGDQRDETEAYDWHCTPSNLHVSEEQRAVSVNHSTGTVAVVCRLLVVGFLSQSTNVVSFLSRSPLQQSGDGGWGGVGRGCNQNVESIYCVHRFECIRLCRFAVCM